MRAMKLFNFLQAFRLEKAAQSAQVEQFCWTAKALTGQRANMGLSLWQPPHLPRRKAPQFVQTKPQRATMTSTAFAGIVTHLSGQAGGAGER